MLLRFRHPRSCGRFVRTAATSGSALERNLDCLRISRDAGTALVARQDVAKGSVALAVGEADWLSMNCVRQSPVGDAVSSEPKWVQLALYLVCQSCAQSGTWQSYLEDLEGSSSRRPVLLWSTEELQELEGTQVYNTMLDYRAFFQGKYAHLKSGTLQLLPAEVQAKCTFEVFVRAAMAVKSHLFPPFSNADPALIPIADLAVHSRQPNTQWKVSTSGFLTKTKTLEVLALRDIAAGEPISIDYAPDQVESQVVLDFGTCDAANGVHGYVLPIEIPAGDRCYDDKLDIVELQGMSAAQSFVLLANEAPTQELMAYLRLINVAGTDMFLMEGLFRNEVWGHMCEPVSEANEAAVCNSMVEGCSAALAAYPTSLPADIKLLADGSIQPGSRKDIACQTRVAEKKILDNIRVWFERRLQRLDKLEYYQERRLKRLGLIDDDGDSTFEEMTRINM